MWYIGASSSIRIEELVKFIKPLEMASAALCGDSCSMVQPIVSKVIRNYMKQSQIVTIMGKNFKTIVQLELKDRIKLDWKNASVVNARQVN